MKKSINGILSIVLVLVLGATVFTSCGRNHEHGFSEEWKQNETGHWHACTGKNCEEKGEFAEHVYDNDADTTCNVCDYVRAAHIHAAATAWSKDATNHWHECNVSGCNEQLDKAAHTWDEGTITTKATFTSDGVKTYTCTVCEQTKTETVTMEYIDLNFVKSDA